MKKSQRSKFSQFIFKQTLESNQISIQSSALVVLIYSTILYHFLGYSLLVVLITVSILGLNFLRKSISSGERPLDKKWFVKNSILNFLTTALFCTLFLYAFTQKNYFQIIVATYMTMNAIVAASAFRLYLLTLDFMITLFLYALTAAVSLYLWQSDIVFVVAGSSATFLYIYFLWRQGSLQKKLFYQQIKRQIQLEKLIVSNEEKKVALLKNQKMSIIGEILSGIMHEINNPVMVISAQSQLATKFYEEPKIHVSKIKSALEKISKAAVRTSKIITSTKALVQETSHLDYEFAAVNFILQSVEEMVIDKIKEHEINFRINYLPEGSLQTVKCHPLQISQCLINLINNSIDARLESRLNTFWIEVNAFVSHGFLCFSVSDAGHGLTQQLTDQLKGPFITSKKKGAGNGLGLYITKKIVNAHNGELIIGLTQSKNTEVLIKIPLTEKIAIATAI